MKYISLPDEKVRRLSFYLAMEEYVARHLEEPDCFFMWQVEPSVIFGRNQVAENELKVTAAGDGQYYLRGLCMENGQTTLISQIEFTAERFGNPALNPYSYVSAGLYDFHEGDIGTGNEKGIAFARDSESLIGFSIVDFGKAGTDEITVDIFALNGDPYDLEFWAGASCRGS